MLVLTLLLAVASYATLLFSPENYTNKFPVLVVYFAGVTLVQHLLVTRSTKKDPRTFVRNFFGIILGVLLLHFAVLVITMVSQIHNAHANKIFTIGFCVGYFAHLIFETTALVLYVRRSQKEATQEQ